MHTCGELLYSFAFGHYSSYAKAAELKKTLVVEQFGKEPDLARLSTRSPGREGMPAKIPAVRACAAAGALRGKKGGCGREEGNGRKEGAAAPLEVLRALLLVVEDRVASALCCLFAWLSK